MSLSGVLVDFLRKSSNCSQVQYKKLPAKQCQHECLEMLQLGPLGGRRCALSYDRSMA